MENLFESNTPIYLQLVRLFNVRIASGDWQSGDRLPSVRDLAVELKVNPNTVQRALGELEREGLVFAERTSGRFITSDEKLICAAKRRLIDKEIQNFMGRMRELGLGNDEAVTLLAGRTGKEEKTDGRN